MVEIGEGEVSSLQCIMPEFVPCFLSFKEVYETCILASTI
jgi:hypothetical protein